MNLERSLHAYAIYNQIIKPTLGSLHMPAARRVIVDSIQLLLDTGVLVFKDLVAEGKIKWVHSNTEMFKLCDHFGTKHGEHCGNCGHLFLVGEGD